MKLSEILENGKLLFEVLSDEAKKLLEPIQAEIKDDIEAVKQRDPAARSDLEVLLLYSGVHAILAYRVAHKLYLSEHYFAARAVSQTARQTV